MYSVYVHIPFCKSRCHYCDFNTYTGMNALIPDYISALADEIRIAGDKRPKLPVHSIYFGGGTPSLIPAGFYDELLSVLQERYQVSGDCEVTLEANPGKLTDQYLSDLHRLGMNRISIGVQSTDSFDLTRLDRIHDINDILKSIRFARKAGFDNISLDMIFGLPWQELSGWERSLSRALTLQPDHFSLYSLIIEPGTPLYDWHQRGLIEPQDQDLEGDMYQLGCEMLDDAGYEHYEISNWAKRSPCRCFQSRHNKQYWYNKPYLGFGAGAHGYAENTRIVNVNTIADYIERIKNGDPDDAVFPASPAAISTSIVDRQTQMKDFMMLGLRLVEEGGSAERFRSAYDVAMTDVFREEISKLINLGLVEWAGGGLHNLRLSKRGLMVANQVFMEFV